MIERLEVPIRKRSVWKPLLWLTGGLAAIPLAFGIWIDAAANRKMEWMEKQLAAMRAEADGHTERRPVYREPLLPGNAWDDYLDAMDLLRTTRDFQTLTGFSDSNPKAPMADDSMARSSRVQSPVAQFFPRSGNSSVSTGLPSSGL